VAPHQQQQQQQPQWREQANLGLQHHQQQQQPLRGVLSMVPSAAAQEDEVCVNPSVHQLNPSVHQLNPSMHSMHPLQLQPSGLGEARTLRDLGDIILLQHLQQQMEHQQQQQPDAQPQDQRPSVLEPPQQDRQQPDQQQQGFGHGGNLDKEAQEQAPKLDHVAIPTDELQQIRRRSSAQDYSAPAAAAAVSASQLKKQPVDANHSRHASHSSAAAAAAATALASARQLPSVREQLWVVVVRCGRKWVSSRQNLMTDLLLTALLGLALGAAQVSAIITKRC
jgi:hypothetical protein